MSKIKAVKNMVSNLDVNKLYTLQEYVSKSQIFFNELDLYINEYSDSFDYDSEYEFTKKVINLYNHLKNDLKLK